MGVKILLLSIFCSSVLYAQPINERYQLGVQNTIFGSVIVLDSGYIVAGLNGMGTAFGWKGFFTKFDLNGDTLKMNEVSSDTMGFDFAFHTDLIRIKTNKFALLATLIMPNRQWGFQVNIIDSSATIELNSNIFNITDNTFYFVNRSVALLESNLDDSYTGLMSVANESSLTTNILLVNISNTGVLNWFKIIPAPNPNEFRLLIPRSIVQKSNGNYIIGGFIFKTSGPPNEERAHIRILEVDTIGNVIHTFTDTTHPMDLGGEGLTLTVDGDLIFGRLRGFWDTQYNGWSSNAQIVCLDSIYQEKWVIEYGDSLNIPAEYNEILPIENNEFVAVGTIYNLTGKAGSLMKFNEEGEVLWNRSYIKIPRLSNPNIVYGNHELYDVERTPDSGFVMVGEARNFANPNEPMGQLGWLVKTDKHGCLVPGCEEFDNPSPIDTSTVEPIDTVITPKPTPAPKIIVYPNPVQNELNIYFASESLALNATAALYSSNGQIVNQWPIANNFITYILDVSDLASGVYILKIINGAEVATQKVVVE
ncbi:hypothetical protein DNU06_05170 [Putridiphycobacter roseus]|uniref:4Fe-4S Mo/W bis-MGD-type domain-containing protein n=1 Tax=Putridiphycobacter roseus TaxID=2219161 RepID=A0A2W1N0E3_9FLAO|nr:T9SS type A sorting domain-containing protein [Putridiphycobacter roseus]PZE18009.1 hypothetical protein DNU06_05170 [Putridiphycobacter roseus]